MDIIHYEHKMETTIYKRGDKLCISWNGQEFEVWDCQPPNASSSAQVITRGAYNCPVTDQPTLGIFKDRLHADRISFNVSRLATQIDLLKTQFPADQVSKALQNILDIVSKDYHEDAKEIARLSRKLVKAILSGKSAVNMVKKLISKISEIRSLANRAESELHERDKDLSKMIQFSLSKNSRPALHFACLHGMSPYAISNLLRTHGRATLNELVTIQAEQMTKNLSRRLLDFRWVCRNLTVAPIHLAALRGNVDTLKYLLSLDNSYAQQKATITKTSPLPRVLSVLELCAFSSFECFSFVLGTNTLQSHGIDAETVLKLAMLGGNMELLSAFPTLSGLTLPVLFGKTGLIWENWGWACRGGQTRVLDWIFQTFQTVVGEKTPSSSNSSSITSSGETQLDPLHAKVKEWHQRFWKRLNPKFNDSAYFGAHHKSILEWLSEKSSQVDLSCEWSELPHQAVLRGAEESFDFFLQQPGFDPSAMDQAGWTIAHYACRMNADHILTRLLDWVNDRRYTDRTQAIFGILVDPNQDLSQGNVHGEAHMVHIAAEFGSLGCLKWALKNLDAFQGEGGQANLLDLKFKDSSGEATVASIAAQNGHLDILEWLPVADLTKLDNHGFCPLHHAFLHRSVVEGLHKKVSMDLLMVKTRDGRSLVHLAVKTGSIDVLDYLASKLGSTCLEFRDNNQNCPVHAFSGKTINQGLLEWFKKHDMDFGVTNGNGDTIAHLIASRATNELHLDLLKWIQSNTSLTLTEVNGDAKTALDLLFSSEAASAVDNFDIRLRDLGFKGRLENGSISGMQKTSQQIQSMFVGAGLWLASWRYPSTPPSPSSSHPHQEL